MAKKIFHVQETILNANGFSKEIIKDRNSKDDKFYTLLFENFALHFNDRFRLEVNYTYLSNDGKNFKLDSSEVALHMGDKWEVIPIINLRDLLTLILIIKGNE